jgi:hypothetical protein
MAEGAVFYGRTEAATVRTLERVGSVPSKRQSSPAPRYSVRLASSTGPHIRGLRPSNRGPVVETPASGDGLPIRGRAVPALRKAAWLMWQDMKKPGAPSRQPGEWRGPRYGNPHREATVYEATVYFERQRPVLVFSWSPSS